ncbi:MAG TPA: iron chelate uptake ABC transporter family permease subunit, partial [Candidatus Tectomicrobia bacterium]
MRPSNYSAEEISSNASHHPSPATQEGAEGAGHYSLLPGGWRSKVLFTVCFMNLFMAALAAVAVGAVAIPPRAILELLITRLPFLTRPSAYPETFEIILFSIRLPRVALMAVTGAALAAAGATYQGLFRNPLADPYLVGVASGAGLGATLALTLKLPGTFLGLSAVPLAAFAGALFTVTLVVLSAQVGRTTPISTMLLAGVAIGAFAAAVTTFLMLRAPDGLRRALNWLLGGYAGGGWQPVWLVLPYLVAGLIILQV